MQIRYNKVLKTADFCVEELNELEYSLKVMVIGWMKHKETMRKRIAWNAMSYLSLIDHNNYFVDFYAKIDGIIKQERETWRNIEVIRKPKNEWRTSWD